MLTRQRVIRGALLRLVAAVLWSGVLIPGPSKVPQQKMGSIFAQMNDRWAVLGSVGWQQWSKFGQVELGIDDTTNPRSIEADLDFKNT